VRPPYDAKRLTAFGRDFDGVATLSAQHKDRDVRPGSATPATPARISPWSDPGFRGGCELAHDSCGRR